MSLPSGFPKDGASAGAPEVGGSGLEREHVAEDVHLQHPTGDGGELLALLELLPPALAVGHDAARRGRA